MGHLEQGGCIVEDYMEDLLSAVEVMRVERKVFAAKSLAKT